MPFPKGKKHTDATREKIQASVLITRLHKNAIGEIHMTPAQVRSAEVLLKKVMPDMAQVESLTKQEVQYLVQVPEPIQSGTEWEARAEEVRKEMADERKKNMKKLN